MKNYKEFEKAYIGTSDIAALLFAGCSIDDTINPSDYLRSKYVNFGGDNDYFAYICNEHCEIGEHYKKVATFGGWLKIYDDSGLAKRFNGHIINVYRAGEYGCIIEIIN